MCEVYVQTSAYLQPVTLETSDLPIFLIGVSNNEEMRFNLKSLCYGF